jgi:predicted DNA-binding transcriptional regulator AlpA
MAASYHSRELAMSQYIGPDVKVNAPERDPDQPSGPAVTIHDRLTWGLDEIAAVTGLSRRLLERERSAGRLPAPDLAFGRRVLWFPRTIRDWLDRKAAGRGGRP